MFHLKNPAKSGLVFPPIVALILCLLSLSGHAQTTDQTPENRDTKKGLNPAFVAVEDDPRLPRVLIIGDSISIGYTSQVRELLKGKANVHRAPENCGDTAKGLANLDKWLGSGPWAVIHFNFGLHDLKYVDEKGNIVARERGKQMATREEYEVRLREFTARLKKVPGAKLIFATTTPVPPGTVGRVAGEEAAYNEIGVRVMKEMGVSVNDLCAFVAESQKTAPPRPESEKPAGRLDKLPLRSGEIQLPYNVHFTADGYRQLGSVVARSIGGLLPPIH
jgi:acyl-CoA thioesterase-1